MTKRQAEVIVALADHNMNISAAARGISMCHSNVYYYVYAIIRETGLDPRIFRNLCKLLPEATAIMEGNND